MRVCPMGSATERGLCHLAGARPGRGGPGARRGCEPLDGARDAKAPFADSRAGGAGTPSPDFTKRLSASSGGSSGPPHWSRAPAIAPLRAGCSQ